MGGEKENLKDFQLILNLEHSFNRGLVKVRHHILHLTPCVQVLIMVQQTPRVNCGNSDSSIWGKVQFRIEISQHMSTKPVNLLWPPSFCPQSGLSLAVCVLKPQHSQFHFLSLSVCLRTQGKLKFKEKPICS